MIFKQRLGDVSYVENTRFLNGQNSRCFVLRNYQMFCIHGDWDVSLERKIV